MVDDLRAALDQVLTGDAEQHLGVVMREALRPVIEQAFRAGFRAGAETAKSAVDRAIETALRSGEQALRNTIAPRADSEVSVDSRPHRRRGRRRVASGTLRTLVEMILTEQPGQRVAAIQEAAQEIDNTISPTSVGNEIRRHVGTRYRREGVRWYLVGETEKVSELDRGDTIPGLEVEGGGEETSTPTPSIDRAA